MPTSKPPRASRTHGLIQAPPETYPLGRTAQDWAPDEILRALQRGRNEHSVRSDLKGIHAFGAWLGTKDFPELCRKFLFGGVSTEERQGNANRIASRYRAHLMEAGYAPSTVKRRLDAVKSVVKTARIFGAIPWGLEVESVPIQAYRDTKGPGSDPFSDAILALEKRNDPMAVRDLAILVLVHDLALRRNEVASLDLEHVDFAQHRVWIKGKKRLQREEVPISPPIEKVLRGWLAVRGDAPGPLFTNFDPAKKGDGRLDGSSVWRVAKKYGLGRTHGLRHLAITEYAKTEKDVIKIMKFARHKDPKTTMTYIDNLKETTSEASMKLAELRDKRAKETGDSQ
jgi:integrase/recombinase XerC